ncbi:MAG: hypothetical protein K0S11_677 [Gammaproteobacteria bacterium]|jgi:type II secretory pathway pseudopilin PulG|nr:hypothetical protein [Gammaproteobacteria bacterium]
MKYNQSTIKVQTGISLLELMLALAITASIMVASMRFFGIANENAKVNNAVTIIREITDASFKWYESNPQFDTTNFKLENLVKMQLLPAKYTNPANINPWGDAVDIEGLGDNFKVIMANVPIKSCNMLAGKFSEFPPSDNEFCTCGDDKSTTCTFTAKF